ncbi:hypothetical protein [Idiomarina sp. HP20-50]|uniref:hypothetical protein n=1 Tax=Idiomarina sp. HP20-50 TaxID=3070813 RepID=UPI00294AA7AB|nr:hypothetical protein [Idiomarina sp. HP20-50]MDV6316575.1 hypothetical protein [Idiomarina sp. HP20-50]
MNLIRDVLAQFRYRWLRKYKSLAGSNLKRNATAITEKQWLQRDVLERQKHPLPGQLIVNLTSFPDRFPTLHLTLKSLLLQSVQADKVILWLYESDIKKLPQSIVSLQKSGLTIAPVSTDTRSYKKLIPALENYPNAFHVTADDDIYYRPDWLSTLTSAYTGNNREILCWRAHYLRQTKTGHIKPYRQWYPKSEVRGPDPNLFFTSGAGVLFPPGCFDERVTDQTLALSLAPYADDLWWFWLASMNSCIIRRVGNNPKLINWKGSGGNSLWQFNKRDNGGNDAQLHTLLSHFGLPPTLEDKG